MPLLPIILAIIPTLPKLAQLFTKPKTGVKEAIGLGVITPIAMNIINVINTCGLSCVNTEEWAQLSGAIITLIIYLSSKANRAKTKKDALK